MAPVIENHKHRGFVEEAARQGWELSEGPWGYSEDADRSVKLRKPFPALGGEILLWMVDRNLGVQQWDTAEGRWVFHHPKDGWRDSAQAWHTDKDGHQHALVVKLEDVLNEGLSEEFWSGLTNTCDNCGRFSENLHPVAFANKACDDCVQGMAKKLEFPGWTN